MGWEGKRDGFNVMGSDDRDGDDVMRFDALHDALPIPSQWSQV